MLNGPGCSTSYTAVGSGFDPQGVPAEKPRNLLTHPPSQCRFAGTVAAVWEYISGTSK